MTQVEIGVNGIGVLEDDEARKVSAEALALASDIEKFVVKDYVSLRIADGLLVSLADRANQLEKRRKFLVDPLNHHVSSINAWFKSITQPLVSSDRVLRTKVLAYRREEKERADEERRQAEAQAAEANRRAQEARALAELASRAGLKSAATSQVRKAMAAAVEVRASLAVAQQATESIPERSRAVASGGSVGTKKRWRFTVVQPLDVPRAFLAVDTVAIEKAVRAGERKIPGVHIYEDEELSVRGTR